MIRFRLASPNWRDLLKELFIVVVGIWIAFAVNNWAVNRDNQAVLQDYLKSLQSDLAADTLTITENLSILHKSLTFQQSLIPNFYRKMPGADTIASNFFRRSPFPYFSSHAATFNTLVNTGDLKLVKSFRLKKAILDHYDKYEVLYRENERAEDFTSNYVAKYMMTEIDQSTFFQGNSAAVLQDFKFRNIVFSMYGIIQIQEKRYKEALERSRALITMLSKEIEG